MQRHITNRPVEIRAEGDKAKKVCGLASVYYDGTPETEFVMAEFPGERYVERIMPGAFDDCLKDDVRCLFNHEPSAILGRTASGTLRLAAAADGLRYECDLGDTAIARDVAEHVRRGDVSGSSFAFDVGEQTWTEQRAEDKTVVNIREVRRVSRLWDVSPVTYPAYEATVSELRTAAQQAASMRNASATAAATTRARVLELKAKQ